MILVLRSLISAEKVTFNLFQELNRLPLCLFFYLLELTQLVQEIGGQFRVFIPYLLYLMTSGG